MIRPDRNGRYWCECGEEMSREDAEFWGECESCRTGGLVPRAHRSIKGRWQRGDQRHNGAGMFADASAPQC